MLRTSVLYLMTLVAAAFPLTAPLFAQTRTPRPKVGAYYFDGWSGKTTHISDRLKTEFANREPVWGWLDNTPAIMQQQIDVAADHGLSFFSFCWYWPEKADKQTPLNNALDLYLQAPNRQRMEFCLLVANHGGYRIGPKDWDTVCEKWITLFKQPTHLKVNDKPLLIFFSASELLKSFGGAEKLRPALDQLRQRAVAAGLKGVTIAVCCTPGPENGWNDLNVLKSAGFDLFTGYNYPGAGRQGKAVKQTFASLTAGHISIYDRFAAKTTVPYMPTVTTGWDKRPWEAVDLPEAKQSVCYDDRTPAGVADAVRKAIDWVNAHPDHTTRERLVLLYAWNENGEGGYLTPTKAEGDVYLKAVAEAIVK